MGRWLALRVHFPIVGVDVDVEERSWTVSMACGSSFERHRGGVSRVTAVETATHAYLARNCPLLQVALLQVALRTDS